MAGFFVGGILKALGAAHPRSFLLLGQKKRNQRKRHPKTCPSPMARGSLRFSRFPARVNSLPAVAQTCTRFIRKSLRCSAASTGLGCAPRPLGAAEHRRQKTEKREDCLTERSEGVPQRPFCAEERREVGAQRRPSLGVPFLFVAFLWASKEKGPACGAAPAIKTGCAPPRAIKSSIVHKPQKTKPIPDTTTPRNHPQPNGLL